MATKSPRESSRSGDGAGIDAVKIDGHYDGGTDIAWPCFEGFDSATVVLRMLPAPPVGAAH
jgi:hypothetical protein